MLSDLTMLRQQKEWTIRDLAKQSGVAKSAIGSIENHRSVPRADTICMLARALEMSPAALFEQLIAGEDY